MEEEFAVFLNSDGFASDAGLQRGECIMVQASTATQPSYSNESESPNSKVFPLRLSEQGIIRSTLVELAQAQLPIEHRLRLTVEYAAAVSGLSSEFEHSGGDVGEYSRDFLGEEAQRRFSVTLAKRMEPGGDGLSVVAQLAQMRIAGEAHWGVDVEFRDCWGRGPEERLGSCEQVLRDPESAWRKFRAHISSICLEHGVSANARTLSKKASARDSRSRIRV